MNDPQTDRLLAVLLHGSTLKQTPRSGWVQRGIPNPESVAAHSYGVVLATLALAAQIDRPIDLTRALAMATLHDLPEALTTDIPTPVKRFMTDDEWKTTIERNALAAITADVSFGDAWRGLWEECAAAETAEARLVKDADTLDMLLQAYVYEQQTGNRMLAQFWSRPYTFYYAAAQAVYATLVRLRGAA